MQDPRKATINVSSLQLGMFVAELDRPWLDSPFMLQGFLLEDDKQIQQLQKLCKTVVIDRTLSTGEHHISVVEESAPPVRANPNKTQKITASNKSTTASNGKISFFDILKELSGNKGGGLTPRTLASIQKSLDTSSSSAKASSSTRYDAAKSDSTKSLAPEEISITTHLKNDVSNVFSKVRNWLPGKNKVGRWSTNTDALSGSGSLENRTQSNADTTTTYEVRVPVEVEMAVIYPVFEKTQIATREIFEAIANENKIDLMNVNQALDSLVASIERNPDALMWLAKLKQRDDYAYNHALNVSINLMALAHFMALPKAQIKDLGLAGLLQDIGKVKIPEALLHKVGELTPNEAALMRSHIQIGLDILNKTENIPHSILSIIANHHERINGSGYPLKLRAEQISLAAQMAGIMDTYCALTSDKVYSKGTFNQQALEQIYESRDQEFSAALVNQLIQFIGIYPVSSLVELNSGEVAVVIQQNNVRRLLPRVMVLLAPDKTRNEYPATLDLIHAPLSPSGEPYKIVRGLPSDSYGLNPADFYL